MIKGHVSLLNFIRSLEVFPFRALEVYIESRIAVQCRALPKEQERVPGRI